jgi:hypothetical protein
MWGVDEDCEYVRSSFAVKIDPEPWTQVENRLDVLVGQAINRARETAIDELEILEFSPTMSAEERVRRLLYLLQKDILGSELGGLILEKKFIRDAFFENKIDSPSYALQFAGVPLPQSRLVLCAVAAAVFAIMMLIYVLYFAMEAPRESQIAWVSSFTIWILFDFFLVSTGEALVTNLAIPSIIFKNIVSVRKQTIVLGDKYKDKLAALYANGGESPTTKYSRKELARDDSLGALGGMGMGSAMKNRNPNALSLDLRKAEKEENQAFNVANFFHVSDRLAKYYTELPESRYIQTLHSLFVPGYMVKNTWLRTLHFRIKQVSDEIAKARKSIVPGGMVPVGSYQAIFANEFFFLTSYFAFKSFIQSSYFMQDTIVQFVIASLLFFLLLVHVFLYNLVPALVLLPLAIVLLLVVLYVFHDQLRWTVAFLMRWHDKRVAPMTDTEVKAAEGDEFGHSALVEHDDVGAFFEDFAEHEQQQHAKIRLRPAPSSPTAQLQRQHELALQWNQHPQQQQVGDSNAASFHSMSSLGMGSVGMGMGEAPVGVTNSNGTYNTPSRKALAGGTASRFPIQPFSPNAGAAGSGGAGGMSFPGINPLPPVHLQQNPHQTWQDKPLQYNPVDPHHHLQLQQHSNSSSVNSYNNNSHINIKNAGNPNFPHQQQQQQQQQGGGFHQPYAPQDHLVLADVDEGKSSSGDDDENSDSSDDISSGSDVVPMPTSYSFRSNANANGKLNSASKANQNKSSDSRDNSGAAANAPVKFSDFNQQQQHQGRVMPNAAQSERKVAPTRTERLMALAMDNHGHGHGHGHGKSEKPQYQSMYNMKIAPAPSASKK